MAQSPRSGFLVRWLSLVSVALLSLLLMMGVVQAAPAGATAAEDGPAGEAQQGREGEEKAEGEDSEPEFEETVVVTASRAEQNLLEAPASVSVIDASDIEKSGAGNFGELLRQVPGVNVVQFGARDVQLTGRAATNSLATGSLVMVDGRSIYLDFFGFVMWDFVPTDFNELDQVEVVRGPGSSVWGANAFNGVVNIRTKIPQEMEGTSLTVGAGEYASRKFNLVYAGATENKDLGWKISASYYEQDAFERKPRTLENGGVITPLPDDGTEQPKLDFRLHRKLSEDSHWDLGIGAARTSGLVNTAIGPFDVDDSSGFYYTRFEYQRRQLKLTGYVNMLDGNATNLLSFDATTFQPLAFDFDTNTIDVAVQNGHLFGAKNRLVYGGNVRYAEHDLSIAPLADTRTEIGAFIEDEIRFTDHFHLFLGARIDDVEDVNTVFSPRVSVVMPVNQNNSFRISANQAFRAPSMTNLFLDTAILQQVDLGLPEPFIFPVLAVGNQELEEETILALDAAYNRVWDGGHFISRWRCISTAPRTSSISGRSISTVPATRLRAGRWTPRCWTSWPAWGSLCRPISPTRTSVRWMTWVRSFHSARC